MDNPLRMALSLLCTVTLLALAGGWFRMSAKRRDQYRSPATDLGPDQLALIGQAARLLVGRWWIMAVPAAAAVIDWIALRMQLESLRSLGWESAAGTTAPGVKILENFLASLNHSLSAPVTAWAIPLDAWVFTPILIFTVVRYFQWRQADPESISGANENIATVYIIAAGSSLGLLGLSWLLRMIDGMAGTGSPFLLTSNFCSRLGGWLMQATAYSAWLGWVVHYADPDPRPGPDRPPIDTVLQVFPALAAITLILPLVELIRYRVFGGYAPYVRLDVILVWAAFPLPFLMARGRAPLRDSRSILGRAWSRRFTPLLSAAVIAVSFMAMVNFIASLARQLIDLHGASPLAHALINLPFAVLRALSSVVVLLYLVRVFARPDFDPPPA